MSASALTPAPAPTSTVTPTMEELASEVRRLATAVQIHAVPAPPWWWSPVIVAAAIASAGPCTAALYTYLQTDAQIEVEREKAIRSTQSDFIDKAVDPNRSPNERRQVLRFLSAAFPGDPLQTWADEQLAIVEEEIASLRADMAAARAERDALEVELEHTIGERGAIKAALAIKSERISELKRALASQNCEPEVLAARMACQR